MNCYSTASTAISEASVHKAKTLTEL